MWTSGVKMLKVFSYISKTSTNLKFPVNYKGFFRFRSRQLIRRQAPALKREYFSEISIPQSTNSELLDAGNVRTGSLTIGHDQDIIENEKVFKSRILPLQVRSIRERKQKLILEGPELINIALNAGVKVDQLFYSNEESLCHLNNYQSLDCFKYKITDRTLRDLCGNLYSSKVLAICRKPSFEERFETVKGTIPVTLLCSDIKDPTNMASILTLAAATGCKQILLLKGCVDVWERKVLRSANGAHFQIPIINNILWEDIRSYFPENALFYVADSSSDIDLDESQFHVYDEDINVSQDQNVLNNNIRSESNAGTSSYADNESVLQTFDGENLSCKLYSEISFPNKELFLYVGGETVGINVSIIQLMNELGALKIKLPLENGMESLNASVALSIILYEIKRQFVRKHTK